MFLVTGIDTLGSMMRAEAHFASSIQPSGNTEGGGLHTVATANQAPSCVPLWGCYLHGFQWLCQSTLQLPPSEAPIPGHTASPI